MLIKIIGYFEFLTLFIKSRLNNLCDLKISLHSLILSHRSFILLNIFSQAIALSIILLNSASLILSFEFTLTDLSSKKVNTLFPVIVSSIMNEVRDKKKTFEEFYETLDFEKNLYKNKLTGITTEVEIFNIEQENHIEKCLKLRLTMSPFLQEIIDTFIIENKNGSKNITITKELIDRNEFQPISQKNGLTQVDFNSIILNIKEAFKLLESTGILPSLTLDNILINKLNKSIKITNWEANFIKNKKSDKSYDELLKEIKEINSPFNKD